MIDQWPYPLELEQEETCNADVLVLGGGVAGCMAAIAAAREGRRVVLVEKGATKRSGAGGSGCDHWESAATNPCSRVTPEALTKAMLDDSDGYSNGISHYIECREGYDRLLDIERMGGKVRDTDDEFVGADFRDEGTKLMFAYDYRNRFSLRVWGSTFKPAMHAELRRLGVEIRDRVMVTSLLTEGGREGAQCIGATGFHTRTGKFHIFTASAVVMCMSRPARVWLFSAAHPGLSEFRPPQCIGDGHAMGWRAGAAFTMMEKSVPAEFSAAGRSYPPYGAGNNHNTWFAATLVDARGRAIPYVDRDGRRLAEVSDRFQPAPGQEFFLMGGSVDNPKHAWRGPEALSGAEAKSEGFELPFHADLGRLPEMERRVIWGMMVGEEGKTKIPILRRYEQDGFDPERDVLQCYGSGWTSASFLPQERQLFGAPGGFVNDWTLATTLPGLFAAGDALFGSNCYGHAAATGHYAGRHASAFAVAHPQSALIKPAPSIDTPMPGSDGLRYACNHPLFDREQIDRERARIQAPLSVPVDGAIGWKELNEGIAKIMQQYCGEKKSDTLLAIGLELLERIEREILPRTAACNPHELTRLLEVHDILTVAQMILHASLARKTNSAPLHFERQDSDETDPERDRKFITIRWKDGRVVHGELPLEYFGNLPEEYERANAAWLKGGEDR